MSVPDEPDLGDGHPLSLVHLQDDVHPALVTRHGLHSLLDARERHTPRRLSSSRMKSCALVTPFHDNGTFSSSPDSSMTSLSDTDSRPVMRTSLVMGRSSTSTKRMFLPVDSSSRTVTVVVLPGGPEVLDRPLNVDPAVERPSPDPRNADNIGSREAHHPERGPGSRCAPAVPGHRGLVPGPGRALPPPGRPQRVPPGRRSGIRRMISASCLGGGGRHDGQGLSVFAQVGFDFVPGLNSAIRIFSDRGSSRKRRIALFSGRAPYFSSYPRSTRKSTASSVRRSDISPCARRASRSPRRM